MPWPPDNPCGLDRSVRVYVLPRDPPARVRTRGGRRARSAPREDRLKDSVADGVVVLSSGQRLEAGPEKERPRSGRLGGDGQRRVQADNLGLRRDVELDVSVGVHGSPHCPRRVARLARGSACAWGARRGAVAAAVDQRDDRGVAVRAGVRASVRPSLLAPSSPDASIGDTVLGASSLGPVARGVVRARRPPPRRRSCPFPGATSTGAAPLLVEPQPMDPTRIAANPLHTRSVRNSRLDVAMPNASPVNVTAWPRCGS